MKPVRAARSSLVSAWGCKHLPFFNDTEGRGHSVVQAQGVEQGDPIMPGMYAVGARSTFMEMQLGLQEGEGLFAFLDNTYVVSSPARTVAALELLGTSLKSRASVDLHVWENHKCGMQHWESGLRTRIRTGLDQLPVWVGGRALPADNGASGKGPATPACKCWVCRTPVLWGRARGSPARIGQQVT